jgi:hypothetical protein
VPNSLRGSWNAIFIPLSDKHNLSNLKSVSEIIDFNNEGDFEFNFRSSYLRKKFTRNIQGTLSRQTTNSKEISIKKIRKLKKKDLIIKKIQRLKSPFE